MKEPLKEFPEFTHFFNAAVYFKVFSNMDFINTLSIKISVFFTISTWTLNHNAMLNILAA